MVVEADFDICVCLIHFSLFVPLVKKVVVSREVDQML